ncbi:DUF2388 domain-containing protein [Pseudomonas otitidis]|uniref:DUF2388 domain-containing protein n=1 Tax=Metapseudomonas otitidis TaxID=319939 RepID=UPI002E7B389B|nr:DUF2388 domain-containing protein [Pseudomonas otitidis]MEE1891653.1 DUF2388 domain-containing protein [Pseudomonas otitidis]
MRTRLAATVLALIALPAGSAMADTFWRNVISSGATTASTYVTFKDHKLIVAAREDASSFVASDGQIRGLYLEAALRQVRADNPGLTASDEELASAILASE